MSQRRVMLPFRTGPADTFPHGTPPPGAVPCEPTLPELFEAQSARTPGAVAVVQGGVSITYGELNARANCLAHCLIDHGVGPEHLVAVALPRSIGSVIATVAVVKSGAAVLPLDPDAPGGTLAGIAADARPAVVLGDTAHAGRLPSAATTLLLDDPATVRSALRHSQNDPCPGERGRLAAEHAAYAVYPARGGPGTVLAHDSLVRTFTSAATLFGFGAADVWGASGVPGGELALWEQWCALLNGGRLVVMPDDVDAARLLGVLVREHVTVLARTAAQFSRLVDADRRSPGLGGQLFLDRVFLAGPAPAVSALEDWYSRHAPGQPVLTCAYGTSETSVHAAFGELSGHVVGEGHRLTRLLRDGQVHVLDAGLNPVPAGSVGTVYVAGEAVVRGYLGRRGLTAERFVADPFGEPGDRMFRTGHLARRCADGSLELLDPAGPGSGWNLAPAEADSVLEMVGGDRVRGGPVPRWADNRATTAR